MSQHSDHRFEVVDLLLRGLPLRRVLEHVCARIESLHPDYMCTIFVTDASGARLHGLVGGPRVPPTRLTSLPIGQHQSVAGHAAWTRARVIVPDTFLDPGLTPIHERLRETGVLSSWAEPVLDADGKVLGTFSIHRPKRGQPDAQDVLNLEQGAQLTLLAVERDRLREDARLLERAYVTTRTPVFFCDLRLDNLQLVRVNPALCELLRGTAEEVNLLPLSQLVDCEAMVAELMHQGNASRVATCRRLDGSEFLGEIRLVTVPDEYAEVHHYFGTLLDVTEKIRASQALAESESRFRRIFEQVPQVAVRGCTPDGQVQLWNPASERLFGYSAEEALGQFLPRRGAVLSEHEYELERKDGSLVPVFGTSVCITSADGTLESYTFEIDLSRLREAEQERLQLLQLLFQAQKMEALGQLTGGIAHDFNNILATILGNVELARTQFEPDLLDEIQAAAERARDLTQRMLSYSQPQPATRTVTRLQEPIRDVCGILSSVTPSSIELRLALADNVPPVHLDPGELHQILANLVINARDALQGQGQIEVGLCYTQMGGELCSSCLRALEGPYVEIYVADDGPGVPETIVPRIFDPFFTTKGVGKGSGLGLAVLHRLAHERGGHVLVKSGPGARFRVLLKPAVEFPPPPEASPTQGLVMVIDDEPMLARMLGKLLHTQGYQARVFTDCRQAWEEFAKEPERYAAVITDQTMPGKTGDAFARDALRLRPDLPILLCTGFSEKIDAESARALGIRFFFQKPVKPKVLFEALAEAIRS